MNGNAPEPVPNGELEEIEAAIGEGLPKDYRWFLQHYGKSLFEQAVDCPCPGGETLPFGFFYGANASGEGVLKNFRFHQGEFPSGFIPIGEASLASFTPTGLGTAA